MVFQEFVKEVSSGSQMGVKGILKKFNDNFRDVSKVL